MKTQSLKTTIKLLFSLVTVSLLLGFGITSVRSRPNQRPKLEGATIKTRLYIQNNDGSVIEKGSMTVELSANGNWRKTKYNEKGQIEYILLKDIANFGVFMLTPDQKDIAVKMSNAFARTDTLEFEEYRQQPGFKEETFVHGRRAIVQIRKGADDGDVEYTEIPAYDYPVKTKSKMSNGSFFIEEAVSIAAREPNPQDVSLPPNISIVVNTNSPAFRP